jgi:biotin synthase
MRLDRNCERILDKPRDDQPITREEARSLMQVDLQSPEMYVLCAVADNMSRRHFDNTGDVCAQIGLDFAPCPSNCDFCVFAAHNGMVREVIEYPKAAVVRAALECEAQKANAIYLMTTCNYKFEKFLEIGRAVREAISPDMPLVANIPDFNDDQARALVEAGFHAVYHAVRLNEGKDTRLPVEKRLATIEAARRAGLALNFCVEPLGPEHSIEQQVELMFLGRELGVTFSGAMHRVSVPGTALARYGEATHWYLARTVAVTRLVMGSTVAAHCTHEPNMPSLLAGANLVWAEVGANPRDKDKETEKSRGLSVLQCQGLLRHAGYRPRVGPSPSVFGPAWQKQTETTQGAGVRDFGGLRG